jgi:hypothetical protein
MPDPRGALICLIFLSIPVTSLSRTWRINPDGSGSAPTIQAGIDSADVGDTVLVSPGVFSEQINFRGKDIVVKSDLGPDVTTIDASQTGNDVVTFSTGETRAAVLAGFKIMGGTRGVFIAESQPAILNNVISGNTGAPWGAGICCGGADREAGPWIPLISGNVISSNSAQWNGGGICVLEVMVPEILHNEIRDNTALQGDGGGIWYLSFFDGALIRENIIFENVAGDHGGGIYAGSLKGEALQFECSWNLVINNTANGRGATGNSGGGLWMRRTSATIANNTIVGNRGNGPSGDYGGGIVLEGVGTPVVQRNIIALTEKGGGILCADSVTPLILINLAWHNEGGDGVGDCSDWWTGGENMVTNPLFCDPATADYSVAENSPAMTHPFGPIGALGFGCGPVTATPLTWGSLKSLYTK